MSKSAIEVTSLHKSFRLPHEQSSGIKQMVVNFATRKKGYEIQQVLRDVSFDIKEGEFFGIVGRNGSGKSTLLKLLAGIYAADEGHIQINGSLTPFIELGVGFNPELTGHENVFLNGALLGFGRKEMESMYDDIVDFAELGKFMDQKLKNYSSGMQVRLAFSIAIRARSDILLLDEVLAVGDENFQRKCMEYFVELKRKGQTVVFITHDMSQVRRFCDRALYLENGEVVAIGSTGDIADRYVRNNLETKEEKDNGSEAVGDTSAMTATFQRGDRVGSGEEIPLTIAWKDDLPVKNVGVALTKDTGEYVFGTNTIIDKFKVRGNSITYTLNANLAPGKYSVAIGLFGDSDLDIVAYEPGFTEFAVEPSTFTNGWSGFTKLEHDWS